MTNLLHVGFFHDEATILAAIRSARAEGLHVDDVWSPHPIHGLDEVLGLRRSRLGIVCFVGGVLGATAGFALQYWASAIDWPLNVGGMPFNSFPAFVPMAFELTILFAAIGTVVGLLMRNRLRPGRPAAELMDATTDDRYALVLSVPDGSVAEGAVQRVWKHGASETLDIPREDLR